MALGNPLPARQAAYGRRASRRFSSPPGETSASFVPPSDRDACCVPDSSQALCDQPPEELAAELRDDPLSYDAQEVGLDEPAERLNAEQGDEEDDQPVQAAGLAASDHLGRDPGDDQRKREAGGRRDDEAHQRDRERPPLGSEVAEQSPPRHAAEAADLTNDGTGVRWDACELLGHGRDDVARRRDRPGRSYAIVDEPPFVSRTSSPGSPCRGRVGELRAPDCRGVR